MKYAKRIRVTPDIEAAIKRVNAGSDIDIDQVAVYETLTVNTIPLRKRGGLYEGGVIDKSVLEEAVTYLNNSVEGVPMHVMHNTQLLNVGKAFRARIDQRRDGHWEVTSQFYVPLSEEGVVARLDTGVVDQVSVGLLAKQVKCSKCDFDWRNAGIMNLMDLTCNNKHTIGKDGTHVVAQGGLEAWFELSLVDRGAANDARILSADKSRFQDFDDVYKLAASNQNHPETSVALIANLDEIFSEDIVTMDKEAVQALIDAALAARDTDTQGKIDAAVAAAVAPKDEEITTLTARVAELEAAQNTDVATELSDTKTKLENAETALKAAVDYVCDEAVKAQVAAGSNAPTKPETLEAAQEIIKNSGLLIAKLYAKPEGTVSTGADTELRGIGAFRRPN